MDKRNLRKIQPVLLIPDANGDGNMVIHKMSEFLCVKMSANGSKIVRKLVKYINVRTFSQMKKCNENSLTFSRFFIHFLKFSILPGPFSDIFSHWPSHFWHFFHFGRIIFWNFWISLSRIAYKNCSVIFTNFKNSLFSYILTYNSEIYRTNGHVLTSL